MAKAHRRQWLAAAALLLVILAWHLAPLPRRLALLEQAMPGGWAAWYAQRLAGYETVPLSRSLAAAIVRQYLEEPPDRLRQGQNRTRRVLLLAQGGPEAAEAVISRFPDLTGLAVLGASVSAAAAPVVVFGENPYWAVPDKGLDLLDTFALMPDPPVKRLLQELTSPDEAVRSLAVESLARIGQRAAGAIPALEAIPAGPLSPRIETALLLLRSPCTAAQSSSITAARQQERSDAIDQAAKRNLPATR